MISHIRSLTPYFAFEEDLVLRWIAGLVHQLDVGGGSRIAEAGGFDAILAGARERLQDDDTFVEQIGRTLDDLYSAFSKPNSLGDTNA
jgi:hypothetical protein